MNYSYKKRADSSFGDAIEKTKKALSEEGFGVLTEIDVQATLRKKLNEDYDDYVILGACNPSLAYKALLAEKEIGLLLPCNVVVYREGGDVWVSAIRPMIAMKLVENQDVADIASVVEEKLKKVIDSI